mmetsp:Transcript_15628/g.55635  ORF Transcript_15628/g.55635 Transcript_15628/m.55635 type:complete len:211 (+) Transcript_15628:122-754(+)
MNAAHDFLRRLAPPPGGPPALVSRSPRNSRALVARPRSSRDDAPAGPKSSRDILAEEIVAAAAAPRVPAAKAEDRRPVDSTAPKAKSDRGLGYVPRAPNAPPSLRVQPCSIAPKDRRARTSIRDVHKCDPSLMEQYEHAVHAWKQAADAEFQEARQRFVEESMNNQRRTKATSMPIISQPRSSPVTRKRVIALPNIGRSRSPVPRSPIHA